MFSKDYPNLDWWVSSHGYIEIGESSYYSNAWVTLLDEGSTCCEIEDATSFDDALRKADRWASVEIEERFGEEPPKRYDDI